MIDERQGDPEGQAVEDQARPNGHATFEEPTGNDAVIARKEETITDEPEFAPPALEESESPKASG